MSEKACSTCKVVKPLSSFFRNRTARDGHSWQCKACHTVYVLKAAKAPEAKRRAAIANKKRMKVPEEREKRRKRFSQYSRRKLYGLSIEEFDALVRNQKGLCAICLRTLDMHKHTHVDHCHKTGKVRAVLCHECNVSMGLAGDNPTRLREMAEYLDSYDDDINRPKHYTSLGASCSHCGHAIECIDVTERMSFSLGNIVKYLWRAGIKSPNALDDMRKAAWYIQREIQRISKEQK